MLQHAALVWADIPVIDMNRAMAFYHQHFTFTFSQMTMDDMEYAIVEQLEEQGAGIGLLYHPEAMPSTTGSVVYLQQTGSLQQKVDNLGAAGVKVVLPPKAIQDGEHGYIALFIDCEGNKVGLWSMQA
ncbi:VOC family protein [Shewanella sp. NIFS-20-20]|uniref:VOC family protein n=1 Tax=Shewanella sp. NIFS-20-20 TaxID=2853806 RepID=UPI001C49784E|nr:VOC family protein [Shewanella sp. NIFS-20-20]MBV7316553.1 VOC family protein [Shewanella sp. NIFS-20-20]